MESFREWITSEIEILEKYSENPGLTEAGKVSLDLLQDVREKYDKFMGSGYGMVCPNREPKYSLRQQIKKCEKLRGKCSSCPDGADEYCFIKFTAK